ncbi:capsular exopolysaccharide synthesis family protein [Kitasatospora sp. MAP12-15]|uniref:polysaccharide biosynthesis tyrosine autokinase n=1 Tax=unclassified Kitasatospora TaxID=2633591 RepID=UPI0024766E79|nr:polysaccharide biosynthesis tyrosine autokinase [Kitasatospora sp. MAP12-44]MDH6108523.1 capsular exopolysaccharide synthesis family protein [Kitasatospora sp. MAP12-44]
MDLRDYARVLRERWRFVVACVLVFVAAAAAAVALTPRSYSAHARLFVATSDVSSANAYQGGLFSEERVKSYTQIVNSPPVIDGVINALHLHSTPSQLAGKISATAPLDTVLVDIKVTDSSPQQAQAIANETAVQFTQFVAQIEQTSPGGGATLVKVSAVGPSTAPTSPTSPQPALYLGIGLAAGLAVGVSGAILRASLDTRMRTRDDVRRELGLPTLGAVSADPALRGRSPVADPRGSRRAEDLGQLRTALRYAAGEQPPRAVVLASALPGEGRTTMAVDLALSYAQTGRRIVLVESDLREPRLAEYLGLASQPGLTELLTAAATPGEAVQDWGGGLLQVVTAGGLPAEPGELLAGADLRALLNVLQERADLVLLDSPPLLPFTDAALLAAEAGHALLVVRSGVTHQAGARRALESLRAVDTRVLGAVLTAVPRSRTERTAPKGRPAPDTGQRPVPWPDGWNGAASRRAGSGPLTDGVPVAGARSRLEQPRG